jgi:hypothetical protein
MGAVDFSAQELARESTSQIFFRQLIGNGFKDPEGDDLKIPYLAAGVPTDLNPSREAWSFIVPLFPSCATAGTCCRNFKPRMPALFCKMRVIASFNR